MTKLEWNVFFPNRPNLWVCGAVVSSRLPQAMRFDKAGKKLPTPYKLFLEWAAKSMNGNWAATAVPEGFVVAVEASEDHRCIAQAHGPIRRSAFKVGGRAVSLLSYSDGSYAKLAAALGYEIEYNAKPNPSDA
jgi:hypothetical protein